MFQWWRWPTNGIVSRIPFPGPSFEGLVADPSPDVAGPWNHLLGTIHRRRLQLHAVEQSRQKFHPDATLYERTSADLTLNRHNSKRIDLASSRRTFNRNIQKNRGKRKRNLRSYLASLSYNDVPFPPCYRWRGHSWISMAIGCHRDNYTCDITFIVV